MQKFTTEKVIVQFKEKHGDKYNYDKFIYYGNKVCSIVSCKKKDSNGVIHGDWMPTPNNHKHGYGCPKCAFDKNSFNNRITQEEAISTFIKVWGDRYNYDNFIYGGSASKSWVTCREKDEIHGYHGDFLVSFSSHKNITHASGCPKCTKTMPLTTETIKNKLLKMGRGDEIEIANNIIKKNKDKILWHCLKDKCDNLWYATSDKVLGEHGTGCPRCKSSKLEKECEKILKLLELNYKCQVRFLDCRYKKSLPFDFVVYRGDGSILFIIECQGVQHFKPIRFAGFSEERAIKNFELQQIKDQIKRDFCINEKFHLLLIVYNDMKNIKNVLKNFIESL